MNPTAQLNPSWQRLLHSPVLRTLLIALAALLIMSVLGQASAQDGSVTASGRKFLCAAYNTLNGPIGWGLGLLMIAFGAVMLMTGNRNANGIIISAILGGIVLAASGTLLGLVLGSDGADACKTITDKL